MGLDINKFHEWAGLAAQLKIVKLKEKNLRQDLFNDVSQGRQDKTMIQLEGYKIVATPNVNVSVDEDVYLSIFHSLTDQEIAAIRVQYKINKTQFKQLPPTSNLFSAITEKPGLPKLTMDWIEKPE